MTPDDPDEQVEIDCATCTMTFSVPRRFYDRRRADGCTMYCPCGHTLNYPKTDNDPVKLRERVAALEAEVRQLRQDKIQLTHELDEARARQETET